GWLKHCTKNTNYSVIITSRPNAICSYLDDNLRRLAVIGFQEQDIQTYVNAYFRNITNNDNNNQADALIKTLNNNPSLKLLSYTPLYLRLFCYLSRQQMIEMKEDKLEDKVFDELNGMSLSKLYERLLIYYMKWNWTKWNGTKDIPNEQTIFDIFKMEIDYLSHLAWEGLKHGQAIISCEIQEKILHWIKMKYPRKCIAVVSQWPQIHSFGFLQGQESMNPSHPINSVYFPHLTFQEWFAAYHLVHCLYEPVESNGHKEVCSILINQQLTPKYFMMIIFMAGILCSNIENKKDSGGSGLLYFWKLLHSPSLCQLSSIHQMMLYMRCLDACKADTDSPFILSPLQTCHKTLIVAFKSFFIALFNFHNDEDYNRRNLLFDKMIKLHFSNLQFVHLDIIDQLKLFQTQFSELRAIRLMKQLVQLNISPQILKIVVQCCQQGFQHQDKCTRRRCRNNFETMALRASETQMDSIIAFLFDGFYNRNEYVHQECVILMGKNIV
ncbi:NACHT domain-containing protein, partial [Reticulomyxa filosa]